MTNAWLVRLSRFADVPASEFVCNRRPPGVLGLQAGFGEPAPTPAGQVVMIYSIEGIFVARYTLRENLAILK
jgi:hypothetical protein